MVSETQKKSKARLLLPRKKGRGEIKSTSRYMSRSTYMHKLRNANISSASPQRVWFHKRTPSEFQLPRRYFQRRPVLGLAFVLMGGARALKIGPVGVLSCGHTKYGHHCPLHLDRPGRGALAPLYEMQQITFNTFSLPADCLVENVLNVKRLACCGLPRRRPSSGPAPLPAWP